MGDRAARLAFEIDLLRKPFMYRNTEVARPPHEFAELEIVDVLEHGYVVSVAREDLELLRRYSPEISPIEGEGERCLLTVTHPKVPYVFNPRRSEEDQADYCSGMITRVASILPSWSGAGATVN